MFPTSITSLTPVGPDEGWVQGGGDVLDAFQLDHTLVPPPVLLQSLIHSPFLFRYRKTPTTAAATTARTATPVRMKARM